MGRAGACNVGFHVAHFARHVSTSAPPPLPLSPALPPSLRQLPIMLQQYVEHGGCLFKVYVLGETSGACLLCLPPVPASCR